MSNDGDGTALPRQDKPRRITLQGRTFGKIAHAASIGEQTDQQPDGDSAPLGHEISTGRDSASQRTTGERRRAS